MPKRDGIRHDTAPAKEIFPELKGQNRDIAAAKAGLGSGKTLEAAQKVIERNIPELPTGHCSSQVPHERHPRPRGASTHMGDADPQAVRSGCGDGAVGCVMGKLPNLGRL